MQSIDLTIESVISGVYGSQTEAARRLGVVPSAVSMWKTRGAFPDRLLAQIVRDAGAAGVLLTVDDVLSMRPQRPGAAA